MSAYLIRHSALIIVFYALDAIEPFHQHFALQNYTLQYPFAVKERVSIGLALAISTITPAIIIALYTLVIDGIFSHRQPQAGTLRSHRHVYTLRDRLWELNCGVLGLLLSEGAAFVITTALKNAAGKPRPDLIDRCQPKAGSADPAVFGLSNSTICTQADHAILKDGFRSFPSGHSSGAFAGLFYLSLYLAGKLHLFDNRGEVWKTFIVLLPTVGAALIAISRIMDARHHPFDVISGSLLGILVAWGSYRQYFPSLSESWKKGRAYPMRTWGREPFKREPTAHIQRVETEPLRILAADARLHDPVESDPEQQRHQQERNVFRQQLSRSQRQRDHHHRGDQVRQPGDGYWSSASSLHSRAESNGEGEEYELTPRFGNNKPSPVPIRLQQSTAYQANPAGRNIINPPAEGSHNGSGFNGERRTDDDSAVAMQNSEGR